VTGRDEILKALEVVIDPELHRSIVELDMVRSIDVSANGVIDVTVSLTTPGCPIKGHFQTSVAQAVTALDGATHVNVYFDVLSDQQKANLQQKLGRGSLPVGALAQVANVLCIGSGKGGVGKSTLTANLAAALTGEGSTSVCSTQTSGAIPSFRMYGLGATPMTSRTPRATTRAATACSFARRSNSSPRVLNPPARTADRSSPKP
jgi:ATP-binding protein involved in chromosome partitioning